jgi:Polysaccharide lyase family 4, domain II
MFIISGGLIMFTRNTKFGLGLVILLALFGLGSACGSKTEDGGTNKTADAGTGTPYKTTGKEGTISGVIAYAGAAPAPKKIDTSADPVCGQKNPNLETDDNVIKDGKLANVFVYVKDGTTADGKKIGGFTFETPTTEVTLDQNGCHYVPHIIGVQTNQKIKVTNSDPTQHNIHPQPKNNPEWNQTQANGAPPIEKAFTRAEVLVPVKCNQHPWMKAYVGVLKHPFFAVSKADGSFEIKGVPPGTYTIAAWHEGGSAGTEKTIQVTVPASGAAKADFSFGAATASASRPGLEMMPALDVPMVVKP